jgi:hypothetical protein
MTTFHDILKPIGTATFANLIGRAANVMIALTVIALWGANRHTDEFFFIFALGFFFFGVLSNAIATATTPLLISRRLVLTAGGIGLIAATCGGFIGAGAMAWNFLAGRISPPYILALALMSGAGVANGFATGSRLAQERYLLPGATWALRLIPLALFFVIGPQVDMLAWLAVGIGAADWLRFGCLTRGLTAHSSGVEPSGLAALASTYPTYAKVIAASVIMGLNPLIDRTIASLSGPGGISVLETGERLYMVLASLCTIGMMTVLLTRLSKDAFSDDLDANWPGILRLAGIWNGFWLVMGLAIGLWAVPWWLDTLTPLSGPQSAEAMRVYWYYLIGLPAFAFGLTYVKRLQALHRWWVMVGTSVLSVALNVPFSLILRQWMGIPGIALATTLIHFINCSLLMAAVRAWGHPSRS